MDIVNILNTIKANSSQQYKDRVPDATANNLKEVGTNIMQFKEVKNEFLSNLINRIALTIVNNRMINNPLASLKKGGVPFGQNIQEQYTNPQKGKTYTYDSQDLLTVVKPDVKVIYFDAVREDKYSVTITPQMIKRAFNSPYEFETLINTIVSSLYSGDNYDEFLLMKNLLATAYKNNGLKKVTIFDENSTSITDEQACKSLAKAIKVYSENIALPSDLYNCYTPKGDEKKVITFTPQENQVLLLNSTVSANLDMEVLAYAFNLSKAEISSRTIKVDCFGNEPVLGMLIDENFVKVFDTFKQMDSFYNSDTASYKYTLHHWQTYGYSILCNAIAFDYIPKTTV